MSDSLSLYLKKKEVLSFRFRNEKVVFISFVNIVKIPYDIQKIRHEASNKFNMAVPFCYPAL